MDYTGQEGVRKTILQKQDLTNSVSSFLLQIGLAFSALLFIGANDGAMGVLIPSISAHYHIGQATAGQLFLFTAIGYLITTFNNGLLIEKLGSRFSCSWESPFALPAPCFLAWCRLFQECFSWSSCWVPE